MTNEVTISGIRPWLPWIVAIVGLVVSSTRIEFMVQDHAARIEAMEQRFGPKELATFIERRVNMERDIEELKRVCQ